jgi:hypothetical protein
VIAASIVKRQVGVGKPTKAIPTFAGTAFGNAIEKRDHFPRGNTTVPWPLSIYYWSRDFPGKPEDHFS